MAEKQYSIGRFSKLLGVSSDTVRYYEKQGIVRTRRTCNNYRYFTDTDCRGLMMSRMLRSLGFPLKEVYTMLKEGGLPRYVTGMERRRSGDRLRHAGGGIRRSRPDPHGGHG